jgi:hypothetical protein
MKLKEKNWKQEITCRYGVDKDILQMQQILKEINSERSENLRKG